MKDIFDLLSEHGFFQDFPEEYRRTIAECGTLQHWKNDQYLIHEGEAADSFFILRKGLVSIETHASQVETRIIQTLKTGDIVGWSWIFPPYQWSFDVRARDDVAAISFNGKCLRDKCERDPAMGYVFMKKFAQIMSQRLKASRLQLLDMYGTAKHDPK